MKSFFSCVNFGGKANKFLQSCGVKNEPTPVEFAELLVKSSDKLWKLIGDDIEKYLSILRRIAADFQWSHTIAKDPILIAKMKERKILVAIKKHYSSINNDAKSTKKNDNNYSSLASAKDIFINDDIIYQQIFDPLTAPEDDFLEVLYKVCIKKCRSFFFYFLFNTFF